MLKVLVLSAMAAGSAGVVRAQEPPIVAALIGEWSGSGTVTGRSAVVTMVWSREPGAAFLHLRFRNAMAASASRPAEVFEARAYYVVRPGAPATGTWVDSRGVIFPLSFSVTADSLTADWGAEGTERGRTVYRVRAGDILEVIDYVRGGDGQYKEFGRTVLEKKPR